MRDQADFMAAQMQLQQQHLQEQQRQQAIANQTSGANPVDLLPEGVEAVAEVASATDLLGIAGEAISGVGEVAGTILGGIGEIMGSLSP